MVPHFRPTLAWLDVLAVICAFVTPAYKRGIVAMYCDNQASVTAYTSDKAQDVVIASCMHAMWYQAAALHTVLEFAHVSWEGMILPLTLSRMQLSFEDARQQVNSEIRPS